MSCQPPGAEKRGIMRGVAVAGFSNHAKGAETPINSPHCAPSYPYNLLKATHPPGKQLYNEGVCVCGLSRSI